MKKNLIAVLIAALMSLSLMGLLVACDGGETAGTDAAAESAEIQVFKQNSNGVEISNYQIALKQTADEWNGLTEEEREKIATSGYNDALAKIEADGVSNYNIIGQTAVGSGADGASAEAQVGFMLDHEEEALQIYGANGEKLGTVPLEAPQE
jgi:hypothetical protein